MKSETFRTKHFNVVTNSQHGACLLFDRKGLGISQPQTRAYSFVMKKRFSAGTLNKTFLSLHTHMKNIMNIKKQHLSLRSR